MPMPFSAAVAFDSRPSGWGRSARLVSGLTIAFALVFGGCRARPPQATADGRVVITYWEKWSGFEADAMREVVADFNRSQTAIEVRFLSISPIDVKLLLAASSGHPPDLAGLWSFSLPDFAEKGALLPLDEALAEAGLGPDHYVPAFWELCRHRGFTWGLPTTPSCVALFYNPRLFREAGLDPTQPPRTLAELDRMSWQLTRVEVQRQGRRVRIPLEQLTPEERAAGRYTLVQVGHLPHDAAMFVAAWGHWFGGEFYDGERRILANDSGSLAAYQWMRDIVQRLGLNALRDFGASFGQSGTARSPFLAGQAAMVLGAPWLNNFIENYAPGLEWEVAAFPAAPGVADDAPLTLIESDVVVIPRGARHPREAFEFIRYLQQPAVAEKLATRQRKFTALSEVSDAFLQSHPNRAIGFFAELARSPNARTVPRLSIWREYEAEMAIAAERVRNLLMTPEAALAEVQERVQWRYDRVMRRWDLAQEERLAEWRDHAHW
jgi:multiple sugar transport system substrate-binding protein